MSIGPIEPTPVPEDALASAAALGEQLRGDAPARYTVGVGLKQRGGVFSEEVALIVYVREKLPIDQLSADEMVPTEFRGYVTDVVEARPVLIDDNGRYDPLRGGIQISREYTLADGIFAPPTGTLGALVRSRATGSTQLLTCAHVVQSTNVRVYQPGQVATSPTNDIVGTVTKVRREFNPLLLDCAAIDVNGSRSLSAAVEGIGAVQGASIQLPALGELVSKRGSRTLVTYGFVVRVIPSAFAPAYDQFEISGAVPFVTLFAGKGDSGSVVLNSSNQVIGLLYAIPDEDLGPGLGSRGLAMPFHNVQEALQVDVAT